MSTEILIPTDGSDRSARRIAGAFDVAEEKDATLHVVYVVDSRRYGEPALSSTEIAIECFEEAAWEHLETLAEEGLRRDVTVEGYCRRGDPVEEIVLLAEELNVDIVVPSLQGITPTKLYDQGLDPTTIAERRPPMTP